MAEAINKQVNESQYPSKNQQNGEKLDDSNNDNKIG
jgi:hypothetical protein